MNMQQLLVLGRATKPAEILESKEGKKYARFSLAVNDYSRTNEESKPCFYNVLIFNKSIEKVEKIDKGDLVLVDGKPSVNAYLSNEGEAKANMVIYANRWRLLK
jgi:single-stranded DNA-binding protein